MASSVRIGSAVLNFPFPLETLKSRKCSRWPEMANCGQACLSQIQEAPKACLVSNIVGSLVSGNEVCVPPPAV